MKQITCICPSTFFQRLQDIQNLVVKLLCFLEFSVSVDIGDEPNFVSHEK